MTEQEVHVTEMATALNIKPEMPIGKRIYVTVRAFNRAGKFQMLIGTLLKIIGNNNLFNFFKLLDFYWLLIIIEPHILISFLPKSLNYVSSLYLMNF